MVGKYMKKVLAYLFMIIYWGFGFGIAGGLSVNILPEFRYFIFIQDYIQGIFALININQNYAKFVLICIHAALFLFIFVYFYNFILRKLDKYSTKSE